MTDQMKVSFDATLEDFIDVTVRAANCSKVSQSQRRRGALFTMSLAALFAFAVTPAGIETRVLLGGLSFVVAGLIYPFLTQKAFEKVAQDACREQLGIADSVLIEVELSPQGVAFKQRGTLITYQWPTVRGVQVTDDRVDFLLKNNGLATVRARAFQTPEEKKEFVELARHYLTAANADASLS